MTEKEKEIGAKLTKKINLAIFILAIIVGMAICWEKNSKPSTAEQDPNSILYNEEKTLQNNLNKSDDY